MAGKTLSTTIVLAGKLSPSFNNAFRSAQTMSKSTQNMMGSASSALKTASIAAGAAVVAVAGASLKAATEYETSLAKVATIADTSKKSLQELSQEVLDISNRTGTAATEINEALYQAISAGADTAAANKLVEVSVKSAKAGFTDAATAVDGLTSVLNAYNMKTEESENLANQFLITQNLGKTTFGELASSIGKLAPIMKGSNISTEEMLSSLAALTANGIQTSEAVSGMKAAMSNIIKPTTDAQKMAKALRLEFNASALSSKGLSGFLEDVKNKTKGNQEIMSKLFGSVEALNAVMALTSEGGMNLMNKTMTEMQTNTTLLEASYNTMAGTPAERIERLKNRLHNTAITIGEKLLPVAENIMTRVENFDFEGTIQFIQKIAPAVMAVASAIAFWQVITKGMLVVQTVQKAWAAFTLCMQLYQSGASLASLAQMIFNGTLLACPITWIILGIAALIAIIVLLAKNWELVGATIKVVWETIKIAFANGINWVTGKINKFIELINKIPGVNIPIIPQIDIDTSKLDEANAKVATIKAEKAASKNNGQNVQAYASGGTVTTPRLAIVGDAPETIVPHGNTPRNRALLAEAAAKVGVGNGTVISVTFAPVIYGGGGSVKEDLLDAEQEFERRMDAYFARKGRVSY